MAHYGIDLGTTTTLVAKGQLTVRQNYEGRVLDIPQKNKEGHTITPPINIMPSFALFLDDETRLGLEARDTAQVNIEASVRAVKRLMGRDVTPYEFGGKSYYPADVASLYVEHVINEVILKDSKDKENVLTVTVPASFTTKQRQDTVSAINKAVQRTGLVLKSRHASSLLISEPLAALLSYISRDIDQGINKINIDQRPVVLVYDIGGGTLDLTMVELSWRDAKAEKKLLNVSFKVIDVNRYTQVGGEDFDTELGKWLLNQLINQYNGVRDVVLDTQQRRVLRYQLMLKAEQLKCLLSNAITDENTSVNMAFKGRDGIPVIDRQYDLDVQLTESTMKKVFEPFLSSCNHPKNCLVPITEFFERTGRPMDSIDYFLCVGGMSKLVLLRENIESLFGRTLLFHSDTAELAVAQGAAIYSMMKDLDAAVIAEPASDAYYVQAVDGFLKIMGRKDGTKIRESHFVTDRASMYLDLFVFAGEESAGDRAEADIYHTLLYQGGETIDLGREYPVDTVVEIKFRYEGDDKTPIITAVINDQEVFNGVMGRKER